MSFGGFSCPQHSRGKIALPELGDFQQKRPGLCRFEVCLPLSTVDSKKPDAQASVTVSKAERFDAPKGAGGGVRGPTAALLARESGGLLHILPVESL